VPKPRTKFRTVPCGTVASCDAFDDIAAWGEHHLDFLRQFSEFYFGVPSERWLCNLINRIDPCLFARRFESWTAALWPDRHDLIAIDGKTARRNRRLKTTRPVAPRPARLQEFLPRSIPTITMFVGPLLSPIQRRSYSIGARGRAIRQSLPSPIFSTTSPQPDSSEARW